MLIRSLDVGKRGRVARGPGNHLQAIRLDRIHSIDGALHKFRRYLPGTLPRFSTSSYIPISRNLQISLAPLEDLRHFSQERSVVRGIVFLRPAIHSTDMEWSTITLRLIESGLYSPVTFDTPFHHVPQSPPCMSLDNTSYYSSNLCKYNFLLQLLFSGSCLR